MRGTGKLHSTKDFRLIFFFFFFSQHCCVVLDLRCRFYDLVLKEVVFFFRKNKNKNQAIMNVFFFVAGKFEFVTYPCFFI